MMADPFSIFSGTVGIIDVTSRFVQYIITTGAAAVNVNEDLRTLLREFETLSSVAKSIQDLQPPAASEIEPDPLKNLRYGTGKILIDCRQTLERLEKLVKDVLGEHNSKRPLSEQHGFVKRLNSFRVQLRKQKQDGEFFRLREQLNTCHIALQLCLQKIDQ